MARGIVKPRKQRKAELYRFVRDFIQANGYSPTIDTIAKGMAYKSQSKISEMIRELVSEGYLNRPGQYVLTLTDKVYPEDE